MQTRAVGVNVAVAAFVFTHAAFAQKADLGADDVRMAIAYGSTLKIEKTGLRLPLLSAGKRNLIGWLGDQWDRRTAEAQGVTLFTPTSWVHRAAAEANALLRPFSAKDVKPDDLSPVLRVFTNVGAEKIAIRRATDSSDMLHPVRFERYEGLIPYRREKLATANLVAVFPLAELETLRSRHPAREFTVVVVGLTASGVSGGDMDVRNVMASHVVIEEKYFKQLP